MVNASQLVELFSISIFPWGICHVCMTYLYMVWSCFVILRDVESVCIKLLVTLVVCFQEQPTTENLNKNYVIIKFHS